MMKLALNAVGLLVCLGLFGSLGCKSVENAAQKVENKGNEAVAEGKEAANKVENKMEEGQEQAALVKAIADSNRPELDRARDPYRHPYETLTFFEVKPDSTVLELWPGRGWYTKILSPYISEKGTLYVTNYKEDNKVEYRAKMAKEYNVLVKTLPGAEKTTVIDVNTEEGVALGLENQVDVVLTFRNVHNWVKGNYDAALYTEAFKALKPGGVFGIVEHRGKEGMTREESAKSGYMDQAQVIAAVEAAGFKFDGSSEINANAKDTKDHPEGVWTLPPSLRLKEKDSAKYLEIGESDRMTLKFRKP